MSFLPSPFSVFPLNDFSQLPVSWSLPKIHFATPFSCVSSPRKFEWIYSRIFFFLPNGSIQFDENDNISFRHFFILHLLPSHHCSSHFALSLLMACREKCSWCAFSCFLFFSSFIEWSWKIHCNLISFDCYDAQWVKLGK